MDKQNRKSMALQSAVTLLFIAGIAVGIVSACTAPPSPVSPTLAPSPTTPTTDTPEVVVTPTAIQVQDDVTSFQQGMTFVSWQKDEYLSPAADQSMTDLASTGANWVVILVTVYQKTTHDTQINATDLTPSDEALIHIITKAHELGLKVLLKPHVDIETGGWRGDISFSEEDEWNTWFTSYRQHINHYAELAQQTNTEAYCIGTELVKTSERSADWERVIGETRSRFNGELTYASNFDEVKNVKWWSAVDYIGIDAYFPLPTLSVDPTVEDLETAWNNYLPALQQLSEEYDRQILLTEIGYRPVKGANNAPWEWQDNPQIDLMLQANLYEAALKTFTKEDWVAGMFFWNWLTDPNQGGENDPDYTPKGKPAEDVLQRYYNQ